MNIFIDNHRLVLEKMIETKVDFILIGGYAVNYHGYNRTTADMDVWIQPKNENKKLLLRALAELDFDHEGIATIDTWNFEKPQLFSIFEQPLQTEFMTHISGVQYEEAKALMIRADIDGITIPVIHFNNLIQNKKASGRPKDIADVEQLERIRLLKR
jgi:predicted nucleotidyltransferase